MIHNEEREACPCDTCIGCEEPKKDIMDAANQAQAMAEGCYGYVFSLEQNLETALTCLVCDDPAEDYDGMAYCDIHKGRAVTSDFGD